jgi:hypothetical protein
MMKYPQQFNNKGETVSHDQKIHDIWQGNVLQHFIKVHHILGILFNFFL